MKYHGVNLPNPNQWIYFCKEANEDNMGCLFEEITAKYAKRGKDNKGRPATIALFLGSRGGHLDQGTAFYDWVTMLDIPLITVGMGQIASTSLIMFLAGKQRYVFPNTLFYFHPGTAGVTSEMSDAEAIGAAKKSIDQSKIYRQIIADQTRLTTSRTKQFEDNAHTMWLPEALSYEFVHQVISPIEVPSKVLVKPKRAVRHKQRLRLVK
jgi:ATP-dependent protease ClpP protease subunit